MTSPELDSTGEGTAHVHGSLPALSLGALGVVYGDIGTSPLYALRECFLHEHGLAITPGNILGILSLIFWALVMVICLKYLAFVMRADNRGEGGILALLALTKAGGSDRTAPRGRFMLLLLGLFGASLLYGEGIITPAISVLSAVEGLNVATTAFEPYVIPITIVILLGLFSVQSGGTAGVALVFGPTMLVWFATIGGLGVVKLMGQSADHINVLNAINPIWAVRFLSTSGAEGFFILGSVVLVITGGEALYADMGHFGARPIRIAWFTVVLPGLLLNYFGQAVLLLEQGDAVRNPFFEMAPDWGLYPLVVLSTLATIIASQALISGSFSLTQQAVQLGYAPRFTIIHTSGEALGQIYIPAVNRALMVMCVLLVLGFQSSSSLAAAYGLAVTGTMTITSLLFYAVARERWGWGRPVAAALVAVFLVFDLSFVSANIVKFFDGAWFPLVIGAVIFSIMTTWKRGRAELRLALGGRQLPMELFLADVAETKPHRVQGTAVIMTSQTDGVPAVLLHHFKHNKILHERVVLLSFLTSPRPEVADEDRVSIEALEHGFFRVTAKWGFMERPSMDRMMRIAAQEQLALDMPDTTFVLGRETVIPTGDSGMTGWRRSLFSFLQKNAPSATDYFGVPANRVIEIGAQVEI